LLFAMHFAAAEAPDRSARAPAGAAALLAKLDGAVAGIALLSEIAFAGEYVRPVAGLARERRRTLLPETAASVPLRRPPARLLIRRRRRPHRIGEAPASGLMLCTRPTPCRY
jgi:hypothetical protein